MSICQLGPCQYPPFELCWKLHFPTSHDSSYPNYQLHSRMCFIFLSGIFKPLSAWILLSICLALHVYIEGILEAFWALKNPRDVQKNWRVQKSTCKKFKGNPKILESAHRRPLQYVWFLGKMKGLMKFEEKKRKDHFYSLFGRKKSMQGWM